MPGDAALGTGTAAESPGIAGLLPWHADLHGIHAIAPTGWIAWRQRRRHGKGVAVTQSA